MIEFLQRIFTDDHYRGSLRLGPFYLLRGKRITWPERFSPDSAEGERARGITVAEKINKEVGADEDFAAILEFRRQSRKTYHAALKAQTNGSARFRRKVQDLTAVLGDEEAAMAQALVTQGYSTQFIQELLGSAQNLTGTSALGIAPEGKTDVETMPDLPPFLNKLT